MFYSVFTDLPFEFDTVGPFSEYFQYSELSEISEFLKNSSRKIVSKKKDQIYEVQTHQAKKEV